MLTTRRHSYEFGPFQLIPAERRLLHNGMPVPIDRKSFDLLVVLIENKSHIVSAEMMITRVWPGEFVEDSVVFENIDELRSALGDGPNGKTYVETMGKQGARFIAPVKEGYDQPGTATVEQKIPDLVEEDKPMSPFWILAVLLIVAALNLFLYGLCSKRNATARPPGTTSSAR
jgi:DNA-binding winged helix-turn-helix (wHTH) protein